MSGGRWEEVEAAYLRRIKPTAMRQHLWKIILILVLVLGGVGYFRYYWVFGTGAKAGELNYVVHKGVLFKTYEGKMIQTVCAARPAPSKASSSSSR